ncbi:MAG: AAA family ATPase, partial [Gammaproteobacteria bacterium]|nr:AAA family ATPase [Gammaproteobacteria bacterium]
MNAEVRTERRPLPLGIQTFSTLREGGYYYVDKTPL